MTWAVMFLRGDLTFATANETNSFFLPLKILEQNTSEQIAFQGSCMGRLKEGFQSGARDLI